MTLDEVKNLSDDELGKRLAEAADLLTSDLEIFPPITQYLTPEMTFENVSVFCKNLNAIAEVEKIVIEKVGHQVYSEKLHKLLFEQKPPSKRYISDIALMTARQRAEACYLALETK